MVRGRHSRQFVEVADASQDGLGVARVPPHRRRASGMSSDSPSSAVYSPTRALWPAV